MFLKRLIIFFMPFVAIPIFTLAQEVEVIIGEIPEEIKSLDLKITDEGGVLLDFGDGRKAKLFASVLKAHTLSIGTEISGNTCSANPIKTTCTYELDFYPEFYDFIWVSHNDEEKVGDAVLFGEDEILSISRNPWLWEFSSNPDFVELLSDTPRSERFRELIKAPRLKCDNFDWVKELPSFEGNQLNIAEWTAEDNAANPETGTAENLIASAYMDVKADLVNEALQIQEVGFIPEQGDTSTFTSLSIGDVLGWSLRGEDRKMCEVSLKMESSAVLDYLSRIFNNPYESEMLEMKGFNSLENLVPFTVEDFDGEEDELKESYFEDKEEYLKLLLLDKIDLLDILRSEKGGFVNDEYVVNSVTFEFELLEVE